MRLRTSGEAQKSLENLEARLSALEENEDRFFLVIMGILIFLMHVGFGFLEAGTARSPQQVILFFNHCILYRLKNVGFYRNTDLRV